MGESTVDLRIEVSEAVEHVHVVRLIGELDLVSGDRVTARLIEVAGSQVIVDLSELRFIDASGITALLRARTEITRRGHQIEFRRAQGLVQRVFHILGLGDVLAPG
jgi:anti-sigma B factor antagonist